MSSESFGPVARLLRAKGFKQVRGLNAGTKAFRGQLICRMQPVQVRIEISDWDFVLLPRIFLESIPDLLKGFRPHVQSNGDLCYYAKGTIVLNRFKPAEAIARCLLRAQQTLEQLAGTGEFQFGVQDEFGYYWCQESIFTASVDAKTKRARLVYIDGNQRSFYVLTQTGEEPEWLARAVQGTIKPASEVPVWLIETKQHPSVDAEGGLPRTIKATLDWVKRWDTITFQKLTSLLETKDYLDHGIAAFFFLSPVGIFGFYFSLDVNISKVYKRKPARYRQYLYGKGARTSVSRIYGIDVSPEFVHTRNIQGNSLIGKKVTVVGCGAIGGYVAHALVRLGAGTGNAGRLTLIDNDLIQPGNLGRHALGFPALKLNKASAIRDDLSSQFPYARLLAISRDVRECRNLFEEDLIIDATGEESLSIALARVHHDHLQQGGNSPLLHVWVAGNGEAVQALLVDNPKVGCYRCMWLDDHERGMKDRMPLLKNPTQSRFIGCQSITMFPVSAGMSAAALALDVVIDWLAGDPSPRFRTRTRENAKTYQVKNQDLAKLKGCPACKRI